MRRSTSREVGLTRRGRRGVRGGQVVLVRVLRRVTDLYSLVRIDGVVLCVVLMSRRRSSLVVLRASLLPFSLPLVPRAIRIHRLHHRSLPHPLRLLPSVLLVRLGESVAEQTRSRSLEAGDLLLFSFEFFLAEEGP